MFPKNKTKQIRELKDPPPPVLFCLLETKAYYTDSVPLCSVLPPLCAPCFLTKSQTLLVPTVMPNELFGQQTLVSLVPCCGLSPGSPGNRMTCSYLQLDNPAPILCSWPRTWPICLSFKLLVPYPWPPLFNSLYRRSPSFRLASHFLYSFSF